MGKAQDLGLKRPPKAPISATLFKTEDVGFSAGMVVADGSVMETLISSGARRGKLDGDSIRMQRWYSTPQVQVSMEDKPSLHRLARMWSVRVIFCQKSSVGNDVWRVYVHGKKAYDLLRIILPCLAGIKRRKAIYLIKKYRNKTSLLVLRPEKFKPFGDME